MDDPRNLRQILFHREAFLYKADFLRERDIHLDRSYLDSAIGPWEKMGRRSKYLAVGSAFSCRKAFAITVNFSTLMQTRLAASSNVFRHLRNQLSGLAVHGDVMLSLERTAAGRLHLHGMIVSESDPREIRQALRKLGGYSADVQWRNGRQVKLRPLNDALGWTQYMLKTLIELPESRLDQQLYVSAGTKRMARDHIQDLRLRANERFGSVLGRRRLLGTLH